MLNLQDFVSKKSSNQKHEEHGADHGYNSVSLHKQVHLPIPIPMPSNLDTLTTLSKPKIMG